MTNTASPQPPPIPLKRLTAAVMTACKGAAVFVAFAAVALHIATWGRGMWSATIGAGCIAAGAWAGIGVLWFSKPRHAEGLRRWVAAAVGVRTVLGLLAALVCVAAHKRVFGTPLDPQPFWGAFLAAGLAVILVECVWFAVRRRPTPAAPDA